MTWVVGWPARLLDAMAVTLLADAIDLLNGLEHQLEAILELWRSWGDG